MSKIQREGVNCQPPFIASLTTNFSKEGISTRVKELKIARVSAGLTQRQLAGILGISQQLLQKIESGAIRNPKILPQIERALGVPFGALQKEKIADYHNAPHPLIASCPLISWQDANEWPLNKEKLIEDKCLTPLSTVCVVSGDAYATSVEDDSMTGSGPGKNFEEGDTIVVDPSLTPKNKSYVLCSLKNRIFFRQYREETPTGKVFLVAKNGQQYPRIELTDDIKIIGVVVAHVDLSLSIKR